MKKLIHVLLLCTAFTFISKAQQGNIASGTIFLPPLSNMSSYDSLRLSQLPALALPEEATRRLLPYAIDNSVQPWFRPLIAQVGLECGQASSIGVVFTYEMNYLRNVPGNVPENQYATHFAYDFINGGSDRGVSFFETFEILEQAGNPTVADYGGMATGGPSHWMNGYNLYYNAMHNRVSEVYSIKVNTPEGLQTLKNWIFDHGNGSSAGGLGCFYAEFTHPPAVLPEGTPEAGKHVIYSWGNSANHAMSIVGYNDSIRWDYNGDGQYTNTIDINADGVVDMRDWEIGGFKMANTYGSISGWGDQGFSYMMYKSVADQFQQGGIWNNTVVVIDVRDNHEPQLTAKVSLTYPCRELLRVMAGISSDPDATEPDHILHYPIFDFQGGCNPMQGSTAPENLEFGLDLNLLLQYINPGEEAKFFLLVQENDPLGSNSGTLESFSLVDYTHGGTIISSQINELPLVNNGITMLGINASPDFDPVTVTTESLPPMELYSNYAVQLDASGGTTPYRWRFSEDYDRFDSTSVMPQITAQKLSPSSSSSGKALVELPFAFPYFGEEYSEVYATTDGYLMFENSLLPWPYYIEGRTYFIETPMIAPAMSNPFVIDGGQGDGIWYEESADYVTFRWKLSVSGSSGTTFNATARLFPDGKIELNYGDFNVPSYVMRFAGISGGDGENYSLLTYDPDFTPATNQLVRFVPVSPHNGLSLSEDGLLSGQANQRFTNLPLTVCATDKNNLKNRRTFYLNTEGLQMDYDILAGNDSSIGYGDTCRMTLHITNLNAYAVGLTHFVLSSFDTNFVLTDTQEDFPGLQPGESASIPDAFVFIAKDQVPDQHQAAFILDATAAEGAWERTLTLTAYRTVLEIASINILDGNNGIIEPGESFQIAIALRNAGGAALTGALAQIATWDPYLTIETSSSATDTLNPGGEWPLLFNAALSPETPLYHLIEFNLTVSGNHQFSYLNTIPLFTGFLAETFESGDFSAYNWETTGDAPWYIEEDQAYEGSRCARSGLITDNGISSLFVDWDVAYADSISFWFKVSSEAGYDYLHFYTGQGELAKWAGIWDWTGVRFPVAAGPQTLAWKYIKDYSVSNGEDCARVDYIVFPPYAVPTAVNEPGTSSLRLSVFPNPAARDFTIAYTFSEATAYRILVIDAIGRVAFDYQEEKCVPNHEYVLKPDVSLAKPGVYSIVLQTPSTLLVRKLVKTLN